MQVPAKEPTVSYVIESMNKLEGFYHIASPSSVLKCLEVQGDDISFHKEDEMVQSSST